jgi:shikimate dehydrogenase
MKAALIGRGIAASLTPAMHEAEGARQGLSYAYGRYDLAAPAYADWSLETAVDAAQAAGCLGVNVTYPFKQAVLSLLDDLTPEARDIGAVNTVVFKDGQRIGHNTDYIGFRDAFATELGGAPRDKVLLLGAGGAGFAVALALIDLGVATLWLHDRDEDAAQALVDRLSALRPAARCAIWTGHGAVDGILNATPMGMASHPGQAICLDAVTPGHWVGDIVYFPLHTALLRDAAARGLRVMTGGGMAIGQAAASFELFTGRAADLSRMPQTFHRLTQKVSGRPMTPRQSTAGGGRPSSTWPRERSCFAATRSRTCLSPLRQVWAHGGPRAARSSAALAAGSATQWTRARSG